MSLEVKREQEAQEVKTPIAPSLAQMLEAPETDDERAAREAEEAGSKGDEAGKEEAKADAATADVKKELEAGEKKEEKLEQTIEEGKEAGLSNDELSELRGMLRDMRQENLRLKMKIESMEARQNTEMGKEPDPSTLQKLQDELNSLSQTRKESYTTLLEAMELNPKFEDVRSVCTKNNFDDIFEAVAKQRSEDNGTSMDEELLGAQLEVWKLPNPYRYMYDVIKKYHPAYKEKEPEKKEEKETEKKEPEKPTAKEVLERGKTPVKAPGSVANVAGSAVEQGGWTAAKIDSMPENELHKVPKEVYSKWLSGELD